MAATNSVRRVQHSARECQYPATPHHTTGRHRQQLRQPVSTLRPIIALHITSPSCISSACRGRRPCVLPACRLCSPILPGHFMSPDARLCLMYHSTCPCDCGCTALRGLSDSALQRAAVRCCGPLPRLRAAPRRPPRAVVLPRVPPRGIARPCVAA